MKNQQLSSYPRCDYLLQVAVEKARLGLGYVCSCQEMQLAGSLRNGFRDFSLKNRGFRDFCLKNRDTWRLVLQCKYGCRARQMATLVVMVAAMRWRAA